MKIPLSSGFPLSKTFSCELGLDFSAVQFDISAKLSSQSCVPNAMVLQFGVNATKFAQALQDMLTSVSPKLVMLPNGPAESLSISSWKTDVI